MFDDDLPRPSLSKFSPCNLENLSVADLEEYIGELDNEILRVKDDIKKKKSSQDAAASVFKI